MKPLVCENYEVQWIDGEEMRLLDGGGWWNKIVKGTIWYEAVTGIINDWDNVKKNFVDGWNIDQPKK